MVGAAKGQRWTGVVPEGWRRAAEAVKEPISWPTWPMPPSLPSGTAVRARQDQLRSQAAELVEVVFPLAQKAGPGLEGVRLRLKALAYQRERDVTATLEVQGGRSFVTIMRLDAWPSDPHANLRARAHPAMNHVPRIVDGHHLHPFEENARIGLEAFAPEANLPVAVSIGPIRSFRDCLRTVSEHFRIEGLIDLQAPESWRSLL